MIVHVFIVLLIIVLIYLISYLDLCVSACDGVFTGGYTYTALLQSCMPSCQNQQYTTQPEIPHKPIYSSHFKLIQFLFFLLYTFVLSFLRVTLHLMQILDRQLDIRFFFQICLLHFPFLFLSFQHCSILQLVLSAGGCWFITMIQFAYLSTLALEHSCLNIPRYQ